MIRVVSKDSTINDFKEKYVSQRWKSELLAIKERYNKNKEMIENSLITEFEVLCQNATRLQAQGTKGDIKYIYISFLRTSIMNNTSFYRFDAYDENWFLDKEECSSQWSADFIFSSLFQYMEELEIKKKDYARKITSMDIDKIKFTEANKYHAIIIEFIRELIPRLIECTSYKNMGKSPELCIRMGEYIDKSEILYEKKIKEES